MQIKLSEQELQALTEVVDDSNSQEVVNVFLAIFGKKHLPELTVRRTVSEMEVTVPEDVSMPFLKVLDAHSSKLGDHIKNRSVFKLLNEFKSLGCDLGRVFKRG